MQNAPTGGWPATRARGGRLTLAQADHRPFAERLQRNEENRCDINGCGHMRRGFGRWCRKHAKHHEATGHPTAPTVRRGHWRPYVIEAAAFVDKQLRAEHPSVCAGVQWCADELLGRRVVARKADSARPYTGYAVALARMRRNGIEPADLLARSIAATYAYEFEGARLFKADDHWRHQAGRLFLLSSPIGPSGWTQRNRENPPSGEPPSVGPRVRMFAFDRTNAALGVLSVKAADELMWRFNTKADAAPNPPTCIAGQHVTFAP